MILEATLKAALLKAAPFAIPDLRLFNRPIMVARSEGRVVRSGIEGQADLYGVWRGGSHVELELKAADGAMSDPQLAWQTFCRSWGVPHLVLQARHSERVEASVSRWLGEIRSLRAFSSTL